MSDIKVQHMETDLIKSKDSIHDFCYLGILGWGAFFYLHIFPLERELVGDGLL